MATCNTNLCSLDLDSRLYVLNNWWNVGGDVSVMSQSITSTAADAWQSAWDIERTDEWSVTTYSAVILGWHWGWHFSPEATQLPIQLDDSVNLSLAVAFTFTPDGACGVSRTCRFDVSFDCWLHDVPVPGSGDEPVWEVMIWLAWTRDLWWGYTIVASPTIEGIVWDVIEVTDRPVPVTVFLRQGADLTGFGGSLSAFTDWLVTNRGMPGTWYLSSVQFGPEIFKGKGTLSVTSYAAFVDAPIITITNGSVLPNPALPSTPIEISVDVTVATTANNLNLVLDVYTAMPGDVFVDQIVFALEDFVGGVPRTFPWTWAGTATLGDYVIKVGVFDTSFTITYKWDNLAAAFTVGDPPEPPGPAVTPAWTALVEALGGRGVHTLFDLSVTHPVAKTWYLATQDLVVPGGNRYQGLVKEHTGMSAAAAIGGVVSDGGVTLTIINALGTGGRGRKWFDVFAENAPGYPAPYDPNTLTLIVRLYLDDLPGELLQIGGSLAVRTSGYEVIASGGDEDEPEVVRLTFGPDPRRYRQLPRKVVSEARYSHAPEAAIDRPIVPWFAPAVPGLRVPCLPLDPDGGLYLIGDSPLATPLGGVTEVWTVRPDPGVEDAKPTALPVQLTTAGQVVVSVPATVSGNETLTQVAQPVELEKGAFIAGLRVWLKRAVSGTACVGSLSGGIALEGDGLPGDDLVDSTAAFEVDSVIIPSGASYVAYDLLFQVNSGEFVAAFVPGDRRIWPFIKYAKTSGDMHIQKDTSGAFRSGIMARRASATDEAWKLSGKVHRRKPVRQNFTGGGTLRRNVATGVITTMAPVRVPGLRNKANYVGVFKIGDQTYQGRTFGRFKISDLPGTVAGARLRLRFADKAQPTGDVACYEIADFATLESGDWGAASLNTIDAAIVTPSTDPGMLDIDVLSEYNAAKAAGRGFFAFMLKYETEEEGVGLGRWYRFGVMPMLHVTKTSGECLRIELLATPLSYEPHHLDELGSPAAVLMAGDVTYPPLGESTQMAVTVTGLLDEADGRYTGTGNSPIVRGPDIIKALWLSTDFGAGLPLASLDEDAFALARYRLTDWFRLAGGLTEIRDVRDWAARIARSIRGYPYLTQTGLESLHVEPLGGSGAAPLRVVRYGEHGPLRLFPLPAGDTALDPISRVEVFYAFDYLGLEGWTGHAIIARTDDLDETDPPDAVRSAQALDAWQRYGQREAGDRAARSTPENGYEFVPPDQPGELTGVQLRNYLWDLTRTRVAIAEGLEITLPRFALGWRLFQEFQVDSPAFPSAAARIGLTVTPFLGSTETAPDAYQCRRARCQVRELPRLTGEHGDEFPVQVTAKILAWETV
jgi:hypothetical protein